MSAWASCRRAAREMISSRGISLGFLRSSATLVLVLCSSIALFSSVVGRSTTPRPVSLLSQQGKSCREKSPPRPPPSWTSWTVVALEPRGELSDRGDLDQVAVFAAEDDEAILATEHVIEAIDGRVDAGV